jgi:hypothetical protein
MTNTAVALSAPSSSATRRSLAVFDRSGVRLGQSSRGARPIDQGGGKRPGGGQMSAWLLRVMPSAARRHRKTLPQLLFRFAIQLGIIPIKRT